MTVLRRVEVGLAILGIVVVIATVGFMLIEDLSLLDAFYMTMITVTTVGFREVGGEPSNAGKLFTIFVIIAGTGAALYTATVAIELGIETFMGGEQRRRRMQKKIDQLNDHVVLCGFGRVGRTCWEELTSEGVDVAIIDAEPANVEEALAMGAIAIEGDATSEQTLEAAGLDRARVLVSAVRNDSDNLVITLTAKSRRPDIVVVARVVEAESERKLYMAGADRVVAPQLVGGQRLAALALKPDLTEFIDLVIRGRTVEFQVEELTITEGAEIIGKSLRELDLRRRAGALVLAVGDSRGTLSLNPDPDLVFRPGQVIVAVGTKEQLERLAKLAGY